MTMDKQPVITRFAPSPTGFLHIGGARTALFNYLFARHHGGRYLLRIEDTDKARSTKEAVEAIYDGLSWLGLMGDEPPLIQSSRLDRHRAVAYALLEAGQAYRCYATPAELEAMRESAKQAGKPMGYDGRWRDRIPSAAEASLPFVIRVKMPRDGQATTIQDGVQGPVTIAHDQLDDFVLLRADGTPTYMLSVVVDDHDMGITHIIRGDDHLTNGFRQYHLYLAAGWQPPQFAHIPLIHGPDGAKLSKRHGALGVDAYRDMGYLPEALCNYLTRLGWAHGDDEIFSRQQAIEWFDLPQVGRSPSRLDFQKLENLNAHYVRQTPTETLLFLLRQKLELGEGTALINQRLSQGLAGLRPRATNLNALADQALIYINQPDFQQLSDKTRNQITESINLLFDLKSILESWADADWHHTQLEAEFRQLAERLGLGLGKLAAPLRAALTARDQSPGLFDVMEVLGKAEVIERLEKALAYFLPNQSPSLSPSPSSSPSPSPSPSSH